MGWYQEYLVDTGRAAALWLLVGFLVTFVLTRWVTLRIRARSMSTEASAGGPIRDVYVGGVHIHHQVWGILLVLVVGLLEFRFSPSSPWAEVLAALFGVGAALALDEFALWLHLDDVYWTAEGRKSIDAVLLALVVGFAMLVAASPAGVSSTTADEGAGVVLLAVVLHVGFCVVCILKGRNVLGVLALAVPLLGLIGALRLARPASFWSRRFYDEAKQARAARRFPVSRGGVVDRVRDRLAGPGGD